jgi:1,4-alpha-glucan branching enzyme
MGYHARLDELLRECGIRYTYLDTHSLYRMPPMPRRGNFFPFLTGAGLLVLPREVALSNAIWSKGSGYPGDFSYREFHYDYTYSLPSGDLDAAGADLVPFGLKVYRITGGGGPKEFYEPARAVETARRHAEDFLEKIRARAGVVKELTGEPPVFTLPFDMELFGHWWYEGPEFISHLFRMIASSGDIAHASPEDFAGADFLQTITPSESSWGRNGHFDTWLTPEVLHIYPKIAELYTRLRRRAGGRARKIAAAAVRELLLAQSSDWPFFIAWDNFRDYGARRLVEHLDAAEKIIASMENGTIDEEFIREREEAYPVFGKLRP